MSMLGGLRVGVRVRVRVRVGGRASARVKITNIARIRHIVGVRVRIRASVIGFQIRVIGLGLRLWVRDYGMG